MARETSGIDPSTVPQESPEQIERHLDEARSSITSTVWEIKRTMADEYDNVRESVSEALDWRTHVAHYPLAFSLGALTVGFLLGAGVKYASEGEHGHNGHGTRPVALQQTTAQSAAVKGSTLVRAIEHSPLYNQITGGLSDVATHLVNEVVRLGRDVLIPTLMHRLSQKVAPGDHTFEQGPTSASRGESSSTGGRFTT